MSAEKAQALIEKWEPMLLAENDSGVKPVTEKDKKICLAQLLENQENWLKENNLFENITSAGDLGVFTPILVPTVRRIFPALVANQIVGVQPMSMPTGYAFAWRASFAGDDTNQINAAVNPLHRGLTETTITGPVFTSVVLIHAQFAIANQVAVGDDVRDAASGAGNKHGDVHHAEVSDGLTKVLISFVVTGGTIDFPITVDGSTPVFYQSAPNTSRVPVSIVDNEAGFNLILKNYTGPQSTAAGEVLGTAMKSMRVHMERVSVEAKTRKLKAEYTLEMAQDLKAVHNLDAEAELMNVLQFEIASEIDRELIDAINDNATATAAWVYGTAGPASGSSADGQWEQEKLRTLYTRIIKEANRIAVTTRRGPGNFILASTNVISALEGLNNFLYSAVPNDVGPVGGVTRVGTLDGRFAVYVDTFFTDPVNNLEYVTVGYKGPGNMDTGVVYCPYVPIMMQKVTHELTFQPAIGVLTRSAICFNLFGTQNYYRRFTVDFANSQLA